jgi:hypothetical protein
MAKTFDELMREASHSYTQCYLFNNFNSIFSDYEDYNLEAEMLSPLCENCNEFIGVKYHKVLHSNKYGMYDIYATDLGKIQAHYNAILSDNGYDDIESPYNIRLSAYYNPDDMYAINLYFIDLPVDESLYNV